MAIIPSRLVSGIIEPLHKPGDDMGFVPMFALTDRPANAKAQADAVLFEISSGQFFGLHQQEPDAFGLMLLIWFEVWPRPSSIWRLCGRGRTANCIRLTQRLPSLETN